MYGYLSGFSDTNEIRYCPSCGAQIYTFYSDGTAECENCKKRFGVIVTDEDGEENSDK